MYVKRIRTILAVTATGGAAQSFYSSAVLSGHVEAVRYVRGSSGISTDAHLALSAEQSGLSILDCSATGNVTYYPRAKANDTGVGIFGGATGAGAVVGVPVQIALAQERLKVTVTSGGAASGAVGGLTATLDLYLSGA